MRQTVAALARTISLSSWPRSSATPRSECPTTTSVDTPWTTRPATRTNSRNMILATWNKAKLKLRTMAKMSARATSSSEQTGVSTSKRRPQGQRDPTRNQRPWRATPKSTSTRCKPRRPTFKFPTMGWQPARTASPRPTATLTASKLSLSPYPSAPMDVRTVGRVAIWIKRHHRWWESNWNSPRPSFQALIYVKPTFLLATTTKWIKAWIRQTWASNSFLLTKKRIERSSKPACKKPNSHSETPIQTLEWNKLSLSIPLKLMLKPRREVKQLIVKKFVLN